MDLDFPTVGALGIHEQRLVFARALLECGVLPVRVVFPCEMLTDADLDKVGRAFRYGCQRVASVLDGA